MTGSRFRASPDCHISKALKLSFSSQGFASLHSKPMLETVGFCRVPKRDLQQDAEKLIAGGFGGSLGVPYVQTCWSFMGFRQAVHPNRQPRGCG